MTSASSEAIFLVGHGSRDAQGAAEFEEMVRQVERRWPERRVFYGFLEFAHPSIIEAVNHAVKQGISRLYAVPVMLLDAGHATHDIPEVLKMAQAQHPGLDIDYGDHLGFHPNLMDALLKVLQDAGEDPMEEKAGRGLLLVGRGSSDPVANANFYKFSRLVWERTRFETVENAFVGITQPLLEEGLERCVKLGLKHVVVAPYFLFTGALYKKIANLTAQFGTERPHISWNITQYFGLEPVVLQAVSDRVQDVMNDHHHAYQDAWMRHPPTIRYTPHTHSHAQQHAHSHVDLAHHHPAKVEDTV